MDTISLSKLRIGNFTSSEIVALTTNAKKAGELSAKALTYIQETNMVRRLGRSLSGNTDSRPTTWGKVLEARVFELINIRYTLMGDESIQHPTIPFWAGSPDAVIKEGGQVVVVDIKCPFTLKSFCLLADAHKLRFGENIQYIRDNHPDGDKYYWQLVSNAILTGAEVAELIVYCPYRSELSEIRDMVSGYDGNQNKVAWIGFAEDDDLPYLLDGGNYNNLVVISFPIPKADKDFLTERVKAAGEFLEKV